MTQSFSRNQSIRLLLRHLRLLGRVTLNDLKVQYAGSFFGVGWAVLTPLVLLVIYAAVYLIIFQIRMANLTSLQYILYMFAGLVPFLMTSEALVNGAGSVVANKAVWTNTVFPIDLAPVKAVLMSQTPMVVGIAVITGILLYTGMISWVSLLLPIVWGLHILFLIGLSWALSLLTIVLRDIRNIIALLMMALMILSPIAYTPDMVPPGLEILLLLNPLAYFIMAYQSILVLGQVPSLLDWIILLAMSLATFFLGSYFFGRAKAALIEYV